jgi:hypothetical protein
VCLCHSFFYFRSFFRLLLTFGSLLEAVSVSQADLGRGKGVLV